MPFTSKTLSKEIMKRTKLRNKFLKDRTEKTEVGMPHKETIAFRFKEN